MATVIVARQRFFLSILNVLYKNLNSWSEKLYHSAIVWVYFHSQGANVRSKLRSALILWVCLLHLHNSFSKSGGKTMQHMHINNIISGRSVSQFHILNSPVTRCSFPCSHNEWSSKAPYKYHKSGLYDLCAIVLVFWSHTIALCEPFTASF